MRIRLQHLLLCLLVLSACGPPPVRTGLDGLEEHRTLFEGKRIGLITNHTAVDRRKRPVIDRFQTILPGRLTALFAPEHGIKGRWLAGETVLDNLNPDGRIPVFSLYGETLKPAANMLEGLDILVFDIQDIGARFYTYLTTMSLAMEAAAENDLPFVVLDRPNPIGGSSVEGPLLEPVFASMTGRHPVPVRHGLTAGEMALMINGEGWLGGGIQCEVIIIPVAGWKRSDHFNRTGLKWIKPSPNMPDLETATVYPGLCLLEGTNISEGRGTEIPFRIFGAPWIRNDLALSLNEIGLPGVVFKPAFFTPRSIPSMCLSPKFQDTLCTGTRIIVTDRGTFSPVLTGIAIVQQIYKDYHGKFAWKVSHFDRLCGTGRIRAMIEAGCTLQEIESSWQVDLNTYIARRKSYLIYR